MNLHRLLLFLSPLLLTCCQEENPLSTRGRTFLQEGQYQKAADLFSGLPETPANRLARFHGLNISQARLGLISQPEQDLPEPASDSDKANYYFDLGNYYIIKSHLDQAISCYEKALYLQPGMAAAAHNLQLARLLPKAATSGGNNQQQEMNQQEKGTPEKLPEPKTPAPASPNSQTRPGIDGPQSQPGTLTRRLEYLLGRQQVMITVPEESQREPGLTDSPSW